MLTPASTVMVVDDERHLRESLAELFAGDGYQVVQASNGDQALALLAQTAECPDVIFLDLKMPGRDGIATLQMLKATPKTRRLPVVVITAYGGSEQTITAMSGAPLPVLCRRSLGGLSWPTEGRSFSMRSGTCRWRFR
jgi:CheY-like chemotaxis protein